MDVAIAGRVHCTIGRFRARVLFALVDGRGTAGSRFTDGLKRESREPRGISVHTVREVRLGPVGEEGVPDPGVMSCAGRREATWRGE